MVLSMVTLWPVLLIFSLLAAFSLFFFAYRTFAIITCGLYILKQLFEGQKRFLKGFFCKILAGWYAKIEITVESRVLCAHVLLNKTC